MAENDTKVYKKFREAERVIFPKRKGVFQEIYEWGIVPHLSHRLSKEYPASQSDLIVRICLDCEVALIFEPSMENPQPKGDGE